MSWQVRDATAADLEALVAFNCAMALETEDKVLDTDVVRRGVSRQLEDPALGRYLVVAGADGDAAGSLAVTTEWSDWRAGLFWWIQSVYVAPAARRQGVFSALYGRVEELARAEPDVCGLRLYVERENVRAQQTYLDLGMEETDYRLFEVEFDG